MIPYFQRVKYAFRSFFSILDYSRIPDDVVVALSETPVNVAPSVPLVPQPEPAARATQLLTLLQRDGRLVDFLMEDLAPYSDAQVGASVRDVQRCTNNRAVHIDAKLETLVLRAAEQNFVPVLDDREVFIGIVRRRSIIEQCLPGATALRPIATEVESTVYPRGPWHRAC